MIIELFAHTFDIIGKLMISFTAIMVHHRFLKERKVDVKVLLEMKHEQKIAFVGVGLMTISYFLKVILTVFSELTIW